MWQAFASALPAVLGSGGGGSPLGGLGSFIGGTTQTSNQTLNNTVTLVNSQSAPNSTSDTTGSPVGTNASGNAQASPNSGGESLGSFPLLDGRYDPVVNAPDDHALKGLTSMDNVRNIAIIAGVGVIALIGIMFLKGRR